MSARHMLYAFVAGFGGAVALIGFVFLTGSTFGQRCDRAFPKDSARAELCIYNLARGDRP